MKRKRYTDEQVAFALRQAESGTSVQEICRKMGVVDRLDHGTLFGVGVPGPTSCIHSF